MMVLLVWMWYTRWSIPLAVSSLRMFDWPIIVRLNKILVLSLTVLCRARELIICIWCFDTRTLRCGRSVLIDTWMIKTLRFVCSLLQIIINQIRQNLRFVIWWVTVAVPGLNHRGVVLRCKIVKRIPTFPERIWACNDVGFDPSLEHGFLRRWKALLEQETRATRVLRNRNHEVYLRRILEPLPLLPQRHISLYSQHKTIMMVPTESMMCR